MKGISLVAASAALAAVAASGAQAQVRDGKTVYINTRGPASVDYANAKPFPLPRNTSSPKGQAELLNEAAAADAGPSIVVPGGEGDGKRSPTKLPRTKFFDENDGVAPQEYGSANHPYTTSVELYPSGNVNRRAGKLFFRDGSSSFVCSASLIKRGIVVTAAHCVSRFGQNRFYTNIQFIPAYENGNAPFGVWNSASARVMTSYINGTDSCAVSGIVCANDVAVITLQAKSGAYPGNSTGWFGYGTGGYSYVGGSAAITQLGYPVALNGGLRMIRTDSRGFVSAANSNNTVIGSLQTGGSSGGPWVVNFGQIPTLSGGAGFGTHASHNIVVGTTSWGYTNISSTGPKQQGASPFTSGNISVLVNASCSATPAAC